MAQGKCPICNGENLDYESMELCDDQCYYPRTCCDCGAEGEEWYYMEFTGHENILNPNQKEKCEK